MSITIEKGKVSRTQKAIIDALLKLMDEDNFDDVTITQITQEAEVARRTFYLNYKSKSEVLAHYIRFLYEDFAEETQKLTERSFESDLINFFDYWNRHRDVLLLLEKNQQFVMLLAAFEHILQTSKVFDFSSIAKKDLSDKRREYLVVTVAASLWRILEKWVQNDFSEKPEEIADFFLSL